MTQRLLFCTPIFTSHGKPKRIITPDSPALLCPACKYICYLSQTVRREGQIKFILHWKVRCVNVQRINVRRPNLIQNYARQRRAKRRTLIIIAYQLSRSGSFTDSYPNGKAETSRTGKNFQNRKELHVWCSGAD